MSQRRILKLSLIALLVLIVIVIGLQVALNMYFNKWIKEQLVDAVKTSSKGSYDLSVNKLHINIFTGRIYLSDVAFIPDTSVKTNSALYLVRADRIRFYNADVYAFLTNNELNFDRVELKSPVIRIYQGQNGKDTAANETFSLYDAIHKKFESLIIGTISITDAEIHLYKNIADSSAFITVTENNIRVVNFKVNAEADIQKRMFLADTFTVKLKNLAWQTNDKLYHIKADQLFASYSDSLLSIDSLQVIPLYNKRIFSKKAGFQTDRFFVSLPKIKVHRASVKTFVEAGWLMADEMMISNAYIEAYRDKNVERKQKVISSLQEVIKDIPIRLMIGKVKIEDAAVIYDELAIDAKKPGRMSFTNMSATVIGLTTIEKGKKGTLQVDAEALLAGKAKLKAKFTFPLNTTKMIFDCEGRLSKLPMEALNSMTETNANVSITSGVIDSMIFHIRADHNFASGTVKLIYHDLKIEVLNNTDARLIPKERLMTFMANLMFLHHNNPEKNQPVRIGTISYARDPQRFIFNYSWKALFTGITDVVSIKQKRKN